MKLVYVIDDDLILQKIMRRMLSSYHATIDVKCFENGLSAIEELNQTTDFPDLIFLDINMPEMNAWGFLRAYQKLDIQREIPIYILSSSIDQRDIDRAKSIELIKKYLIKPLKKDELHRICDIELQLID